MHWTHAVSKRSLHAQKRSLLYQTADCFITLISYVNWKFSPSQFSGSLSLRLYASTLSTITRCSGHVFSESRDFYLWSFRDAINTKQIRCGTRSSLSRKNVVKTYLKYKKHIIQTCNKVFTTSVYCSFSSLSVNCFHLLVGVSLVWTNYCM